MAVPNVRPPRNRESGPTPELLSLKVEVTRDKGRCHTGGLSIEERLPDPLRSEVMSLLGPIGAPVDSVQTHTRASTRKPDRRAGPLTPEAT